MTDQINVRIIFADKNFDVGGVKSTDTILFLKSVIKKILLNQQDKLNDEIKKSLKTIVEDKIKLKIGFPPVTIEGKEHDLKKLFEMKISNNEMIRVDLIEERQGQDLQEKEKKIKEENVNVLLNPSKYSVKRKIIPADNSCLFNSINYALNQNLDEPYIMRSLIAAEIQSNLDFYNSAILDGKEPIDYCEWIMNASTWGGGIELSILSKCFQIRIGVVDIINCTIEFLGEDYTNVIYLLYNGVHYDLFVREVDEKEIGIFLSKDEKVKEEVLEIAKELNAATKYVDTNKFSIRCNVCYSNFKGTEDAVKHSKESGHVNFMQI